jgi:hypothetical protein
MYCKAMLKVIKEHFNMHQQPNTVTLQRELWTHFSTLKGEKREIQN